MLMPYEKKSPLIAPTVFVAPNATIIGDVEIGEESSVWFGSVIRGDVHPIRIGRRTNIQDHCTLHVTSNRFGVTIADEVTVGHGVIAHGCTIEDRALIGMGARILDGAVIGSESIVAAGSVVSEGMRVPPRTLVAGVPAAVKRPLRDEEITRLAESAAHYVAYSRTYRTMRMELR